MASCPSCGVAVVPGYVKCPKCGNPLPAFARTKSNTFGAGGGTAVGERGSGSRLSLFIALGASVAVAVVLVLVLGGRGGSKTASTTTPTTTPQPDEPATIVQPPQSDEPAITPTAPPTSDALAQSAAADLDRELKRQRLWGTVRVVDQRVDVRSGACEDKGMAPVIDAARPRLQGAGLTKLRCLAQSGTVVFERDL